MSWTYSDEMAATAARAELRRRTYCQCGPMPGTCPSPAYCPMSDFADDVGDEIEDDDAPEDPTEGLEPIP